MALTNKMFKQFVGNLKGFKAWLELQSEEKRIEIADSIVFIHEEPIAINKETGEIDASAAFSGWIFANGFYYTAQDFTTLDSTVIVTGSLIDASIVEEDGLLTSFEIDTTKLEDVLDKKVDKKIVTDGNTAEIFNEYDGGGAKFTHKDGTESFVGVNNGGATGLAAQIYVDESDPELGYVGTRINAYKEGAYYYDEATTRAMKAEGTYHGNDADREIAVKADLAGLKRQLVTIKNVDGSDISKEQITQIVSTGLLQIPVILVKEDGTTYDVWDLAEDSKTNNIALDLKKREMDVTDIKQSETKVSGLSSIQFTTTELLNETTADLFFGVIAQGPETDGAVILKVESVKTETGAAIAAEETRATAAEEALDARVDVLEGLQIVKLETPETGMASSYQLQDASGKPYGTTINIAKDQFLKSAHFYKDAASVPEKEQDAPDGFEFPGIRFEFETAAGKSVTWVSVKDLVDVYTAGDGIDIVNNKISVKPRISTIINPDGSKALIFNESDGGGAKFEHADGTASYVGVSDKNESGYGVQIYVDDSKKSGEGVIIDVTEDAAYYHKGEWGTADKRDVSLNELAVIGDIEKAVDVAQQYIDNKVAAEEARATAAEDTKVDKYVVTEDGSARIFNEYDGGGAKFEYKDGTASYVGVHNKDNGVGAQIYVDEDASTGVIIDVRGTGAYYHKGEFGTAETRDTSLNEIAVIGDVEKRALIVHIDEVDGQTVTQLLEAAKDREQDVEGTQVIDKVFATIADENIAVLEAGARKYTVTKYYDNKDFKAISLVATDQELVPDSSALEQVLYYATLWVDKANEGYTHVVLEKVSKSQIASSLKPGDKFGKVATVTAHVDGTTTIELNQEVATSDTSIAIGTDAAKQTLVSQDYLENRISWETLP